MKIRELGGVYPPLHDLARAFVPFAVFVLEYMVWAEVKHLNVEMMTLWPGFQIGK